MRNFYTSKLTVRSSFFINTTAFPQIKKYLIVLHVFLLFNVQDTHAAIFTVTNTNDAGAGSLRQAILDANLDAALDIIEFDIATGLQTIQPLTPLPLIVNDLIIDGTTQTGFVDVPLIEIDGSQQGAENILRFDVLATGEAKGLIINGGPQSGISFVDCTGGLVDNCYVGTDATGTIIDGNVADGVHLDNSTAIIVQNCLLSGNGFDGVFITAGSNLNIVKGCKIGTDVTGDQILANGISGVRIDASDNCTIGGPDVSERNIVSGNDFVGIFIENGSTGNNIDGNFIGTNSTATAALPNANGGVNIDNSDNNNIGVNAGNVISGNTGSGVQFDNTSSGNVVIGNFIGTDVTGFNAIPNEFGVAATTGSLNNFIGGPGGMEGNLISGNLFSGISVGQNSNGTKIFANQIGTNINCTGLLPNGNAGVLIDDSDNCMIGNGTEDGQNLISGNTLSGIIIQNGSDGNEVLQNCIGVDIAGTADLGNSGSGIEIINSANNVIGSPMGRNIISGNDGNGIGVSEANSQGNIFQNNIIGLDINGQAALQNDGFGIVIFGDAGANQIGGVDMDEGNIVSANLFSGIATAADNQTIEGNKVGTDVNGNADLGNEDHGIFLSGASNCTVDQNLTSGNTLSGISIADESTGNLVRGNKIGTNEAGDTEIENSQQGIIIDNSNTNTIGGVGGDEGNLISGNAVAGVAVLNSDGNKIINNIIGTDNLGNASIPNSDAIFIGSDSNNNEVGGVNPNEGNLLSGNNFDGVDINSNSIGTIIKGNIIGLNVDGTAALANGDKGIEIDDSPNTVIGGTTASERNIISGNDDIGIVIFNNAMDGAMIMGNYVGTDISGTQGIGNASDGIEIDAPDVTIGGGNAGEGNLVSGNAGDGILCFGDNAIIQGNMCGTDISGTMAIPNEDSGIDSSGDNAMIGGGNLGEGNLCSGNEGEGIESFGDVAVIKGNIVGMDITGVDPIPNESSGMSIDGSDLQIGGQGPNDGNLVSANEDSGIDLFDGDNVIIEGNIIGLDITGTVAAGNLGDGINDGSQGFVTIGGLVPAARNIISANGLNGISSFFGVDGEIVGNFIGTDISGTQDLGNDTEGISFFASLNYTVGGDVPGSSNVIAFNAMDGIGLSDDQFFFSGFECEAIQISENSIFSNVNKGINYLGNQSQVGIPILTNVTAGPAPNVEGTLNGNPNSDYTIEYFKNFNANPSGNHEGEVFVGSEVITTDGAGIAIINTVLNAAVNANEIITATAKEINANTSEFSNGVAAGTLPIELISLSAKPYNEDVKLQWSTETELNNKGFHIERLSDENTWKVLAFVNGNGTKLSRTTYSFIDKKVLSGRTYYYRLKQEDHDGRVEYTHVVSAKIDGQFSVGEFYPNPATDLTRIDFNSKDNGKIAVEIFNVLGQKVFSTNVDLEKTGQLEVPISQFVKGEYVARISINGQTILRKFMKF